MGLSCPPAGMLNPRGSTLHACSVMPCRVSGAVGGPTELVSHRPAVSTARHHVKPCFWVALLGPWKLDGAAG